MGDEMTCDPWPVFAKREVHMAQSNRRVDPPFHKDHSLKYSLPIFGRIINNTASIFASRRATKVPHIFSHNIFPVQVCARVSSQSEVLSFLFL